MAALPPIELLQKTHQFPGPYTFKAIGIADESFEARVIAAVRDELGAITDPPHQLRNSEGGKHVAVTMEVYVENADQVHAVYNRILKVPGLVLML